MLSSKSPYEPLQNTPPRSVKEDQIEYGFIGKLQNLKYEYRPDIRDRAALERNFREKFEALNRAHLTDAEFARLLDEIVTPDVYAAAKTLRSINAFTRDDGTPLNYTLVNIKDWCKNHFEVIHQLRINTDYSQANKNGAMRFHMTPKRRLRTPIWFSPRPPTCLPADRPIRRRVALPPRGFA